MIAILLALSLFGVSLQRPADVVRWSAAPVTTTAPAGGIVQVSVTAKIQDGWKLYAITQPEGGPKPLTIDLATGAPFTITKKQIVAPQPKTMKDENFDLETRYYEGEATFRVPVTVGRSVSGKTNVPFEITFQACGAGICLRPFTENISAPVEIR
jgi:DsbC/DsbD-like thiol-disulfide interchange protein